MGTPVVKARSAINIRLPESPKLKDPLINNEMQEVHNALRTLAQYLQAIRDKTDSQPDQLPNVSVNFRNTFWATAGQDIEVGAVCSSFNNEIVNGVKSNEPIVSVEDGQVTIGSTGTRTLFGLKQEHFYIALTKAATGEQVQLGVGPGIIAVTGAVCGRRVWAVDSRDVYTTRRANRVAQDLVSRSLVNNGGLYLDNVVGYYFFGTRPLATVNRWEGYWQAGFPSQSGNDYLYNRVFLYPVGVCIADGYVLFTDYKRSDSLSKSLLYYEYQEEQARGPQ